MQYKKNIICKDNKKNIAIIGAGISGLSIAFLLCKKSNITLYERSPKLGGHAYSLSKNIKINK